MFQYSGFLTMAISYLVRSEGCARVWSWIRSSYSLVQDSCTNWVFSDTTGGISASRSQICTAFDLSECIICKPFDYEHPCGGRHEHVFPDVTFKKDHAHVVLHLSVAQWCEDHEHVSVVQPHFAGLRPSLYEVLQSDRAETWDETIVLKFIFANTN